MRKWPIRFTVYLILGVVPATFLCILVLELIYLSKYSAVGILWGGAALAGTIGLWMALFLDPYRTSSGRALATFLLCFGVLAIVPQVVDWLFRSLSKLGDMLDLLLYTGPITVALHYIISQKKARANEADGVKAEGIKSTIDNPG